jgi:hypothetical protein
VDLPSFRRFLTADGAAALTVAVSLRPTEATRLAALATLRKRFPADLAANALETVLLRQKAAAKCTHAERLFFTREGLEMASGEVVANHRAERFRRFEAVGDFGCGIGADTLALAAVTPVHAVDRDELLTAITTANLNAVGLAERATVHTADLLTDPLPDVPAAFADPGRRSDGKRFLSLADYLPPPAELLRRLRPDFPIAFKLAPGVDVAELTAFDGEAEFISAGGELKECVLWLNGLRTARRRATVLSDGTHTLSSDTEVSAGEVTPIRGVLLDPNAAVVRAGLVPLLGQQFHATGTDWTVRMLSCDEVPDTPFATAYRVEAVLQADAKSVAAELRKRGVGRVTPVVRGSLLNAEQFTRGLKLKGKEHRFLLLTRQMGEQVVVIAERVG